MLNAPQFLSRAGARSSLYRRGDALSIVIWLASRAVAAIGDAELFVREGPRAPRTSPGPTDPLSTPLLLRMRRPSRKANSGCDRPTTLMAPDTACASYRSRRAARKRIEATALPEALR